MKIQSNTMKEGKNLMKQLKKEYPSWKYKVASEKRKKCKNGDRKSIWGSLMNEYGWS